MRVTYWVARLAGINGQLSQEACPEAAAVPSMCQPPWEPLTYCHFPVCSWKLGPSWKHNKFKPRPPSSVSAEITSDIHPTSRLHSPWPLPQIQVTPSIYYSHSLLFMLLLGFFSPDSTTSCCSPTSRTFPPCSLGHLWRFTFLFAQHRFLHTLSLALPTGKSIWPR